MVLKMTRENNINTVSLQYRFSVRLVAMMIRSHSDITGYTLDCVELLKGIVMSLFSHIFWRNSELHHLLTNGSSAVNVPSV